MELEKFYYDNKIVRNFGIATVIWGIIGMTVGLLIAIQLYEHGQPIHNLWPHTPATHQRGNFRFCW
jgi:cytochrome c oxidase cbb3-type subunit I/II